MEKLLKVKRLNKNAKLPIRQTKKSAGADLCAFLDAPLELNPGERALINTGIAISLPENTVGLVYARSGLAVKHGLTLSNSVGVIDEDYTGEVLVGLVNLSDKPYVITPGERIAQLVVSPVIYADITEVNELSETGRNDGGFGSTGKV